MGADVYKAKMTAVRNFPIYGVGKKFADRPMTSQEALALGDLDYEVLLMPAMTEVTDPRTGEPVLIKSDRFKVTVRDDTLGILGTVGSKYKEIQNREAFEFLDTLSETGEVVYRTVGELNGGAKVMLFGEAPGLEFDVGHGDVTKAFFMANLTHDGTGAVQVGAWAGSMACFNLLNTLRSNVRKGAGVSIRHSGDVDKKLEHASKVLRNIEEDMSDFKAHAQHLASQDVTQQLVADLLDDILPIPVDVERPTRRINQREKVQELFESGQGSDLRVRRGTRWGLLNAVTEYTNHERSARTNQTRVNSLMFGDSERMNQQAFRFLMGLNDE